MEATKFCVDEKETVCYEINYGALKESHRNKEEDRTCSDIPTKMSGKCCFYSSTSSQCVKTNSVKMYTYLIIHSMVKCFQRVR